MSRSAVVSRCPHPEKVPHDDEASALRHRNQLRFGKGASSDLAVYPCRCGKWHVGHSRERLGLRIKSALRGGGQAGRWKRHRR